jgi:hypothetical protein
VAWRSRRAAWLAYAGVGFGGLATGACTVAPASSDSASITVSPNGNDQNSGNAAAPLRTLKRALERAQPGDTIELRTGNYTALPEEPWGYTPPAGVTIRGNSSANTRLQGPASDGGPALAITGRFTLEQLELSGFELALEQTASAELRLKEVAVAGADTALAVRDTARGSELSIEDSRLSGGVLIAAPDSTLTLSDSDVSGDTAEGVVNFAGASLDLRNTTLNAGEAPYGISLRAGNLTLQDCVITGGSYGVYQLTGSSRLRRTRVDGYTSIGLYFASGALDLGTAREAGDNAFVERDGAGGFGIYVDTGALPATASDTSFEGVVPPAAVVQASERDVAAPGEYFITPGQRITFFRVAPP